MDSTTKLSPHAGGRAAAMNNTGVGRLVLGLVVSGAAAGALAWPGWSQAETPAPGGPAMHGRMHQGGGMWAAHPRHLERMLDAVKATDAPKAQVRQIMQSAAADMATQREAGRSLRDQAMAVFAAPMVDANAAEQLRQQMVAQHAQGSKRMLAAMLEVSRALTPEQRAAWAERMRQHRQGHHGERQPGALRQPGAPKQP